MKRIIAICLVCTMILSGCGVDNKNSHSTNDEHITNESDKSDQLEEMDDAAIIETFKNLNDPNLLQYVEDDIYSNLTYSFDSEDYIIEEVNAVYISTEYLEEIEYNTKENIYFGYTLSEIAEQYDKGCYVFTLGDDGSTAVETFEEYDNTYDRVLKNVAVGTGVILVCVTVSVVSGGLGAPAISMVFAASAKTGASFALSSGAMSSVIAATVTGIQTGDFDEAIKAGALAGSESFKWGAITGVISGGVKEVITLRSAGNTTRVIPQPRDSEVDALKKYGGSEQLTYLDGKEVPFGTPGATRPDVVRTVGGKLEAIEVKNYNLASSNSRSTLYSELKRQVSSRVQNLPSGSAQRIVLDTRGRDFSDELISEVTKSITNELADVYPNIPIDIMR